MKIKFEVKWFNQYGSVITSLSVAVAESAEETFKNFLKNAPKKVLKTWESVEFINSEKKYLVLRNWWEETGMNWENSNEVLI